MKNPLVCFFIRRGRKEKPNNIDTIVRLRGTKRKGKERKEEAR